jgi:hypothetical protein
MSALVIVYFEHYSLKVQPLVALSKIRLRIYKKLLCLGMRVGGNSLCQRRITKAKRINDTSTAADI